MTIRNILKLAILPMTLVATTGCFDLNKDGKPDINFGIDVCLGNFKEVADGGTNWDVCVGIGNGNQIGAPIENDGLVIEMVNRYSEEALKGETKAKRDARTITSVSLSCIVEDEDGGTVPAAPYIYTDGVNIYVYIPSVPSHFTADCFGSVTLGDAPPSTLFKKDDIVAETTLVMWEDEVVFDWDERYNELQIDRD